MSGLDAVNIDWSFCGEAVKHVAKSLTVGFPHIDASYFATVYVLRNPMLYLPYFQQIFSTDHFHWPLALDWIGFHVLYKFCASIHKTQKNTCISEPSKATWKSDCTIRINNCCWFLALWPLPISLNIVDISFQPVWLTLVCLVVNWPSFNLRGHFTRAEGGGANYIADQCTTCTLVKLEQAVINPMLILKHPTVQTGINQSSNRDMVWKKQVRGQMNPTWW